jgi:hypothetical protein
MQKNVAFVAMVKELNDGFDICIFEQFYFDTVLAAEVLQFNWQV